MSSLDHEIEQAILHDRFLRIQGVIIDHSSGKVTKNGTLYDYRRKRSRHQRHSNLNDLTKGIFTLPEEIIYKILDHVNQMDTIHLALTHRSFREVCKAKLLENICVYYEDPRTNLIPKNWYISEYTNYTFVNGLNFEKLYFKVFKHVKHLFFRNVVYKTGSIVLHNLGEQLNCSITFGAVMKPEFLWWLLAYQNRIKPANLILFYKKDFELNNYPLGIIKELSLDCTFLGRTPIKFSLINEMPNLKKLTLIDPQNLQSPEPVDILDLHVHYNFCPADIFGSFNLNKIKKLRVFYWWKTRSFPSLVYNADKLTSLESLDVTFSEEELVPFVRSLRKNSLIEIGVPESLKSFETIYPALFHHKDSLKVIFENKDYYRIISYTDQEISFDTSFNVDLDLTEFPKLEYVVRNGGVKLVDRSGPSPQFVPVEYYSKNTPSY